jgi:hypothetical protein
MGIEGKRINVEIEPTGTKRYALEAEVQHANLNGTKNPVPVTLASDDDSGASSVKLSIDQDLTCFASPSLTASPDRLPIFANWSLGSNPRA